MTDTSGKSWHFGLLGYPLGHSFSPHLQTAALLGTGLVGKYHLYSLPPEEVNSIIDLLNLVRSGEIDGLNVTIPYKQVVLPHLDELTSTAAGIGAVNTIFARAGVLVGDNTDAPAFLADLVSKTGWRRDDPYPATGKLPVALVLGAGGAARAVVYALGQAGWHVWVVARRIEQGRELLFSLRHHISQPMHTITFDGLPVLCAAVAPKFDLLVNATPVGMSPEVTHSPWPKNLDYPVNTYVYDLVYNPPETAFLRAASASGLRATNGLGMLVEQAALAFEHWTGRTAPRGAMHAAAIRITDGDAHA